MNKKLQERLKEVVDRANAADEKGSIETSSNIHFNYTRAKDKLFLHVNDEMNLLEKKVCDVGTGYGHYLSLFGEGSFGIDISKPHLEFCKSIGLEVYQRNLVEDLLTDLPKVDYVWSSATIEHLDSAHIFLRKCQLLLNDGGTLLLESPLRPKYPKFFKHIPFLKNLYLEHGDHVSFFTPDILEWNLMRTGFRVKRMRGFSIPIMNALKLKNPFISNIWPLSIFRDSIFIEAEKIANWKYPDRSIRQVAENEVGYTYKEGIKN
jgi:2-polyprenyl-3-methyl-5-hydroxy-6-metoxy-1,4-benzoquinol methylase